MNDLLIKVFNLLQDELVGLLDRCERDELSFWQNKNVLVVGSASNNAILALRRFADTYKNIHFIFWGTERCEKYLGELPSNVEFVYHEGKFSVASADYKVIQHKNIDIVLYVVPQPHLTQYENVEDVCSSLAKDGNKWVYCMDMFEILWKHSNIKRYVVIKRVIDNLTKLTDC